MVEAIRQGDIPGVQLRQRLAVSIPAAELWSWVTEAERLSRWLADEVEVRTGDGAGLALSIPDFEGAPLTEEARTLAREERRWVLDWRRADAGWQAGTRVVLEVAELGAAERGGGSELSVLQGEFQRLNLTVCLTEWERYRRRWRHALARLERRLAGGRGPRRGS